MRPDQAPESGKFRLNAAAALDGVTGTFGDDDMVCVTVDSNGDLVLASATNAMGVVWVQEGRKQRDSGSHKKLIGGNKYTVIHRGEFVEANVVGSVSDFELEEGDKLYAAASGAVTTTPGAGARFIGFIARGGARFVVAVGLLSDGT